MERRKLVPVEMLGELGLIEQDKGFAVNTREILTLRLDANAKFASPHYLAPDPSSHFRMLDRYI
jgi:hypothetical protein